MKNPSVASLDATQAQSQDPQYALLLGQSQQAQTAVLNVQNTIASIKQQIAIESMGTNTLFEVIDTPNLPAQPTSRTKVLLLYAGSGLVLAILACSLYRMFVVRRARSLYTRHDAESLDGLQVLLQVPRLLEQAVEAATTSRDAHTAHDTTGS